MKMGRSLLVKASSQDCLGDPKAGQTCGSVVLGG